MNETQVMPLAQMPDKLDETMPLRVADVQATVEAGGDFREDIAKSEVLEYRPPSRPRTMDGRFAGPFPVRRVTGLSVRKPEGVERSGDDTATHALPAVEKMTGKPSERPMLHRTARRIQEAFNAGGWNIAVWYGEHTEEFWVMDETGLHGGFKDVTSLYQGMGWQMY